MVNFIHMNLLVELKREIIWLGSDYELHTSDCQESLQLHAISTEQHTQNMHISPVT